MLTLSHTIEETQWICLQWVYAKISQCRKCFLLKSQVSTNTEAPYACKLLSVFPLSVPLCCEGSSCALTCHVPKFSSSHSFPALSVLQLPSVFLAALMLAPHQFQLLTVPPDLFAISLMNLDQISPASCQSLLLLHFPYIGLELCYTSLLIL